MPLSPQDTAAAYFDGTLLVLEFVGPVIVAAAIIGGFIWALSGRLPEREKRSMREDRPNKSEPEERIEGEGEWPPAPGNVVTSELCRYSVE